MQNDFLPSPGLVPNGQRLRQEAVKAISYCEVVAALKSPAVTEQAGTLTVFFNACIAALASIRETTAPTVASRVIPANSPSTILVTCSEALDPAGIPLGSAFTVAGTARDVTVVAIVGNTVVLTVDEPFEFEDTVTLTYAQPTNAAQRIRDLSGNLLANFTTQAVTNNVPE